MRLHVSLFLGCVGVIFAAPAPRYAASGQGRALGAALDARLHMPQLHVRERRHLRIALEICVCVPDALCACHLILV